jgi:outer membrane protein TolC
MIKTGCATAVALLAAALPAAAPLAAQAAPAPGPYPGITLGTVATPRPAPPAPGTIVGQSQSSFQGSVPQGEATAEELRLSLDDALARGLRFNLGLIGRDLDSRVAQAQRLRALSSLLPQIAARVRQWTGSLSLVTFGFKFPGAPEVIGPFSYQDARVSLTQNVLDLEALRNYQSARESQRAAELTLRDARDTVVVVVGSVYYQVAASTARVDTARAQLDASRALDQQAADRLKSGLSPAIDSLRATVQRHTDEQRLAVAQAALEKDKLTLARVTGLPLGQRFALTTQVPFAAWSGPDEGAALRLAYQSRNDLKSAEAALRAAELARAAAVAQRFPVLAVDADYGRVGKNFANTDGTFTVAAGVSVPLFTGERIAAAVAQADATLERRRSEVADFKGRVDYEVRTAFLDMRAAETSVEVARKNIDLAEQTLAQARDRFANGVTSNLEVVLAESDVAAAHENYIASLFSHNFSKLTLLRAMGLAEQGVKQFLSGPAGVPPG